MSLWWLWLVLGYVMGALVTLLALLFFMGARGPR